MYNEFAYFYDELNGAANYKKLHRFVRRMFRWNGLKKGIVADLGCGTGTLTLALAKDGYDMLAVDVSQDMLEVLADKLPAFAATYDEASYLNQIKAALPEGIWYDTQAVLEEHADEVIYYRTDHHWTTYGAYNAFRHAAGIMGLDPDSVYYNALAVTADFNGTLSGKSCTFGNEEDVISVWFPQDGSQPAANYVVEYVDRQMKTTTFYDETFLTQKDKYSVFFGGNHALVRIKSPTAENRRLLVLKDSYANCFLPFLAQYYRQIDIVDPRYYTENLETLIATDGIDEVLLLYNANTFFSDSSLAGLVAQ